MTRSPTKNMRMARSTLGCIVWCATFMATLGGAAMSQGVTPVRTPGDQTQSVQQAENVALERERLELDRQKFSQETAIAQTKLRMGQAKLDQDRTNARLTALVSLLPLTAAIGTLVYSVWSFRRQMEEQSRLHNATAALQSRLQNEAAQLQFQMKAAEIAFSGARTPEAVHNRAQALKALFGDRLPPDFANRFDPSQAGGGKEVPEAKQFFLELLLKYPEKSLEIAKLWSALFDEDWIKRVEPLLPLQSEKVSLE